MMCAQRRWNAFTSKHQDLRVRVVHGNTLTAAVILNEIPKDVQEVFLTGATSKLGRAIALHLCRKKIRVLMLTLSTERFQKIQKEAPPQFQQYLVQVTKIQAAKNCKTWIAGKWLSPREQLWPRRARTSTSLSSRRSSDSGRTAPTAGWPRCDCPKMCKGSECVSTRWSEGWCTRATLEGGAPAGRVDPPRGGAHRRGPDRRGLARRAQARARTSAPLLAS
uniref:Very-long-chain aldehyde decarbonylase CER1-like C-terminal domain-containing protein n=1 Tax=Ananas comosus var. bracteatus TaxID=296719 RepID=A0A6V7PAI6_ANACO|nr:unnamed protein product [Ananas comosus var. bracteatus]